MHVPTTLAKPFKYLCQSGKGIIHLSKTILFLHTFTFTQIKQ